MPGQTDARGHAGDRLFDSPGQRGHSPAWKRRKMHTPVRFYRSTPELCRESDEKPVFNPQSPRKMLFDSPDSKENNRSRQNIDFGSPGDEPEGLLDCTRQTNINPFYSANLNDSSLSHASTCNSQSFYPSMNSSSCSTDSDEIANHSPEVTMLFNSPAPRRRTRKSDVNDENEMDPAGAGNLNLNLFSTASLAAKTAVRKPRGRGDIGETLLFDVGESPVPVMPSTTKKLNKPRDCSTPVIPCTPDVSTPGRDGSPNSALCTQMKRTCSVSERDMPPPIFRCESPKAEGDLLDEEEEMPSGPQRRFMRHHGTASPCPPPQSPAQSRTPCASSARRKRTARARGSSESSGGGVTRSRFQEEFEEEGILGTGTFGTVFKCRNRLDGCLYAVKVTKQRFKGRADRERVLKEVFALSALCNEEDSPHIVRYFGAFVEDGRLFIQTELCDKSLQDMIRTKSYPQGLDVAVRTLARQVLEALRSLHKHNLVHLDIKPANIFVKNNVFKVGDLGHACLARIPTTGENEPEQSNLPSPSSAEAGVSRPTFFGASSTPAVNPSPSLQRSTSICDASRTPLCRLSSIQSINPSSPSVLTLDSNTKPRDELSFVQDVEEGDSRYMAREILNEDYRQLTKGDIFSLGASLYEMVLGRELPANGPEWHEIRDGNLNLEAMSRVSMDIQSLIRLMLLKDVATRPSAEALLLSGGPGGILRTEFETELARERATAEEYRKELARLKAAELANIYHQQYQQQQQAAYLDPAYLDDRYRFRRSNTM
mmetsp:Transcript_14836/g.28711  ORF Transcript_14836/g.28711 Transcript_14836/m.28711 type:complete len:769 (+) Transcript_14836:582-2888(+)